VGWAHGPKIYPLNRAANRTGAGSRTQFASFNFSNALIWEAASSAPRTASINLDATVPASLISFVNFEFVRSLFLFRAGLRPGPAVKSPQDDQAVAAKARAAGPIQ
jgi:hypothetical protein